MKVLVAPQLLKVVIEHEPLLEQQVPRKLADWQNVAEEQAKPLVILEPTPANTLEPVHPTPVVIEQVPLEEQQVPRRLLQTLSGEQVVLSPA